MITFTFEWTGGRQTLFIFCKVEPHHPCMPPHLNTTLICLRIRMVIHVISTSVLTSPPYFTNYDSTYLQHFFNKIHEYRSASELKLAIWCQMPTHAKKYFERKNTIGWSKAGQLQMDRSPAAYCLKFGFCRQCTSGMFMSPTFSTVYVIFVTIWALFEESIPFKKWPYHLSPLLPHLDLL